VVTFDARDIVRRYHRHHRHRIGAFGLGNHRCQCLERGGTIRRRPQLEKLVLDEQLTGGTDVLSVHGSGT
jgi:hypothetical protein